MTRALMMAILLCGLLPAQDQKQIPDVDFYTKSLHYTSRGLEYWYSRDNGGFERLTGIPFSKLSCNGCHVRSCGTCHAKEVSGKQAYSVEQARTETACVRCHSMESQTFAKKNPGNKMADVHFARGMKCMDCHSAREIHGDGMLYDSLHARGALDTRCEKCHADLSKCPSNALHGGKVGCNACHVREVASCYNCHFDAQVRGGKGVSIPLKNMLFLINSGGKVTAASLLTLVYQNRTFALFAPSFPHSIMKEGRKCADCHATTVVRAMGTGAFKPIAWENGTLTNAEGVIPVLDGFQWNFVSLNYVKGRWAPFEKPPTESLMSFTGYSKPLTKEQFDKLARPQPSTP